MKKLLKQIKENEQKFAEIIIPDLFSRGLSEVNAIHAKQKQISVIRKSRIKELEALVKDIQKMKPTARSKHQDYCCYKKDTARDIVECDCNLSQYIGAISHITTLIDNIIKKLKPLEDKWLLKVKKRLQNRF